MTSPKSLSGGADPLRLGRLSTQGYGRLTPKSPSSCASPSGAEATRLPSIAPPPMAWSDGRSSWQGGLPKTQKPNERVRALICNWPAHFCKESLLRIVRDPLEASLPLQHPYILSVRCDLRRRKVELQNEKQNAYLVAFDTDKLRTMGSGNGIDAMEASNSFLARDCVCSDMIPLRGLYGEVQIELRPPDTAEGDVLVILRIVKSGNIRSMQDWYPIGDPVVVRVEPRQCREDRAYIQSLKMELAANHALASSTHKALGDSQNQCVSSLSDLAEMRGAVARWQLEVVHSREDAEQLHGEVNAARKEMESKHGEVTQGKTAMALQGSLQASRQRQLRSSAQAAATMERSLQASESEIEAERNAINEMHTQISQQQAEAAAHAQADSQAKAAIGMRLAMDKKHMAQLRASEQASKDLQLALDKSRREVQEHKEFANKSRATLERAQTQAAEEREKLAEARSELATCSAVPIASEAVLPSTEADAPGKTEQPASDAAAIAAPPSVATASAAPTSAAEPADKADKADQPVSDAITVAQ